METANVMSEILKRWEIICTQPLTKVYRSKLCRFIDREAKHFALKGQHYSYSGRKKIRRWKEALSVAFNNRCFQIPTDQAGFKFRRRLIISPFSSRLYCVTLIYNNNISSSEWLLKLKEFSACCLELYVGWFFFAYSQSIHFFLLYNFVCYACLKKQQPYQLLMAYACISSTSRKSF